MYTPLNASASTAGALFSSSTFEVPQFQREYSWQVDEVEEFWDDLRKSLSSSSYFLGLIILTQENGRKHVVDGQQRLVTLTLLANALYHEALHRGRKALADRIQADFLRSIDYASDATDPRVSLSDQTDNETFQAILATGQAPSVAEKGSVSYRLSESYRNISKKLRDDLKVDPFKRLGVWTEFLTNRVYFAVFVHPDPTSAYQVFEVINTRGRELTTADLLKNYVLSQTPPVEREARYRQWQTISKQFSADASNTFVQYIRHVVTVRCGHILPKDLFGFLAQRRGLPDRNDTNAPPSTEVLMKLLQEHLPLYAQMVDPTLAGPADPEALRIFAALNSLGVIAVRPILMAMASVPQSLEGMKYILRLVVRRIVVGNLGTGNVERRFGEAAKHVYETGRWNVVVDDLKDLNPTREDFIEQARKRSFNKGVLAFLRRSILAKTITPDAQGVLHFIWTRQTPVSFGMSEEDGAYWFATIGNTFLSTLDRRPKSASDWDGFKRHMLPFAIDGEWKIELMAVEEWNASAIENMGQKLAQAAGDIWF
ncbi:DUF262 domain-containing protein [Methylocystis sp. SC2]|uniref:DUF262 domain-containing protein n=1 Tax=Methylocystis sp. (strain SC2) TaxID=187303 RepID=UPI00027AF0A8|nr:DUF262 domain-containing protein [Methylocystis sp. SC2]CCJ05879.1 Conserved hypothetical protein [Methylocystis sp. SC2]